METVFEVDTNRMPKHSVPVTETKNNPTLKDYIKEELEILRFNPSREMIFDFIGQQVDKMCGSDYSFVDKQDDHDILISETSEVTLKDNNRDSSTLDEYRGVVTPPHSTRRRYDLDQIKFSPSTNASGVDRKSSMGSEKISFSSGKLGSGAVVSPDKRCLTNTSPMSTQRRYGFKHIQLPPSIYLMAAAHDITHSKTNKVSTK
jgi:hypothetical protein